MENGNWFQQNRSIPAPARVRVFLWGFANIMIQSEGASFFLPFLLALIFSFSHDVKEN